jgi:hypothetical protein
MLVAPVGVRSHVEGLHAALWNRPSGQLATTVVYGSKDPWMATDMEPLVAAVPGAETEVFKGENIYTAGLLGKLFVVPAGLCHCRFRMAIMAYLGPKSPDFLRSKPGLLPAKAVLLPSQAGSTCSPFALIHSRLGHRVGEGGLGGTALGRLVLTARRCGHRRQAPGVPG